MLLLKRIHVSYRLKLEPDKRETAERVHGMHVDKCPVARSIGGSVTIETELTIEDA